jgi:hypothetical protein
MADARKIPEVPESALRNHAEDERVDRIWHRLEGELGTARPRPRNVMLWAPAALLIVFGSGVFVGARWFRPNPTLATTVSAEPATGGDESQRPAQAPLTLPAPTTDTPLENEAKRPLTSPNSLFSEPPHPVAPGLVEPPSPPTAALPPVSVAPEWQVLADKGDDYAAAWQAIERQGGFDAVLGSASSAIQLMSLVDVARLNGKRADAMRALRAVIDRFPNDPRAALAAYTLGNMLENAGDRVGAAKAYAEYRALSPKGDFAEDALARQLDAAIAEGNVDLSKQLLEQYTKDFPTGRRLAELRKRVGKLTGEDAGAFAGDGGAAADDTPFDEVDDEAAPSPGPVPAPGTH